MGPGGVRSSRSREARGGTAVGRGGTGRQPGCDATDPRELCRPALLDGDPPRLGDAATAEDVLRDTFTTAIEKIEQFRWTGKSIYVWLRQIAVNKVYDVHRRSKRSVQLADAMSRELPHATMPDTSPTPCSSPPRSRSSTATASPAPCRPCRTATAGHRAAPDRRAAARRVRAPHGSHHRHLRRGAVPRRARVPAPLRRLDQDTEGRAEQGAGGPGRRSDGDQT